MVSFHFCAEAKPGGTCNVLSTKSLTALMSLLRSVGVQNAATKSRRSANSKMTVASSRPSYLFIEALTLCIYKRWHVGIIYVTAYTKMSLSHSYSQHSLLSPPRTPKSKRRINRINDQDSDIEFPPTSFRGNVRMVKCPVHDYSESPSHVYTV